MSRPTEDFELKEMDRNRSQADQKETDFSDKPKRLTPAQKKLQQKKGRLVAPLLLLLTLIISALIALIGR